MPMVLHLRSAARSDVGLVRAENEDSGYAGARILVVADGMGGHAAGELASSAAVAKMAAIEQGNDLDLDATDAVAVLEAALDEAHDALAQHVEASPESAGLGTTLTALAWLDGEVAIVHVGDSRAYLLRDGLLAQLTKDDTYVQTLVDSGRITEEEAFTHDRRNLLTQALDGVNTVEPEFSVRPAHAGDRYLLCSDGLCGVVPPERLRQILNLAADPTGVVDALVEEALQRGAPDNVTVVVADVIDIDPADAASTVRPTVVGAAFEQRNRERLPDVSFPADRQPVEVARGVGAAEGGGIAGESPTLALTGPGPGAGGRTGSAAAAGTSDLVGAAVLPQPSAATVASPDPAATAGAGAAAGGGSSDSGGRHGGPKHAAPSRSWWPRTLAVVAVVALAIGLLLGWQWLRNQYFVGELNGRVAVFQGIPLGFGEHGFSTVEQESATQTSALPEYERSRVEQTIPAATAAEALSIMNKLAAAAQQCASAKPPTGCPGQPAASASASAGSTAAASPAATSTSASPAQPAAPAPGGTP